MSSQIIVNVTLLYVIFTIVMTVVMTVTNADMKNALITDWFVKASI